MVGGIDEGQKIFKLFYFKVSFKARARAVWRQKVSLHPSHFKIEPLSIPGSNRRSELCSRCLE
jgi:hypothetical protein